VLERMMGAAYAETLKYILTNPLGLNVTSVFQPSEESLNAVVLPGGLNTTG